ncbi:histone deacetylase family protein [Thalassobius sp. S69A]|uniref:histone deacetylase family protein n=1 Tax=unclassified Thalassovita TaxID=2619711 RepID=UPI000C12126A|nr:acetoin utilization protein [Paracoccaceae bacterium]MBT26724.1 acetoin utilization protein [Paracoccaceae bacterium]
MTTAFYSHTACWGHVTPAGHPEQVARLDAVTTALKGMALDRHEAPLGTDAQILLCHPETYLQKILKAEPQAGSVALDEDTFMSAGSVQAARRAVGAAVAAVDTVLDGRADNAFVACRPPGHHAETARQMGFCLFGNVAIAAKHALARGVARVAVVDFDVHHGNGTQDLLWDEPQALFFSSHQSPLWPGTGTEGERGAHDQIVNLPLLPESGGAQMRETYERRVFPMLDAFAPELLLISAGFDAHRADPLAQLNWEVEDFVWLTRQLKQYAKGRVVSVLEGGYDLHALGMCVAAHVAALMDG